MVTFANLGSVRLSRYGAFSVSAVVGPVTLTFDLLTSKRVHESPGSWASMVPDMGFRGLHFVFALETPLWQSRKTSHE